MRVVNAAGLVIGGASVVYFLYLFSIQNVDALVMGSQISDPGFMTTVLLCSVQGILLGACWYLLVKDLSPTGIPLMDAISIVCLSQLGKYIPGNLGQHVGRIFLARRKGLRATIVILSIFYESLLLVGIATTAALAALLIAGNEFFGHIQQIPAWWILASMVVLATVAPTLGHRVFERVAHWWAKRKGIESQSIRMPELRTFWLVGLFYIANYLILGLILQIIAERLFDAQGAGILLLSGIFAVAWIAGFITPGAPAGLGVREVVLVAALTPVYDQQTAVGIAAVLRIATVLGDGVAFLVGLGLSRFARPTGEIS